MKIQLNTDKNIEGTEGLESYVSDKIRNGLKHYSDKITRIEVHLTDQNADKVGVRDIQCKIEARVEGMQPVLGASQNSTKERALDDAVDKVKATLSTVIGKRRNS